jgi:multicomponent Na+:H+ antiporter subunit D
VALGLLVAGYATKAGLVPFHTWLPDAHTAAPGPVSALFSGLMVNLGVVASARLAYLVFDRSDVAVLGLLTALGVVSGLLGALMALFQDDLKRLLAFDTVSQMGVLAVGAAAGGAAGAAGLTYHLVSHALFKSLLFLCAGTVLHATGETDLSRMGGLWRRMPAVAGAFVLGVAAIAGVPPLTGYVSLGLIHDALLDEHEFAPFAVMIVAQAVTVAALSRAAYLAFFARPAEEHEELDRPHAGMVGSLFTLAAGCLAFGALPQLVLEHAVRPAAAALTSPGAYAGAALGRPTTLTDADVSFGYFSPVELATAAATTALGLALAWLAVHRSQPRVVAGLLRLHTGSVNDYAAFSGAGLVAVVLALLLL